MGVFTLPSLGSDMESGTLVEWLVSPGDTVNRGDVVAVIETQKGAIEIECFEEGVVKDLLAETGKELPVGAPLALIQAPGETLPETAKRPEPPAPANPTVPPGATAKQAVAVLSHADVVPASPAARRKAQELHVDLSTLKGTFPNGGIVLADVEAAAGHQASGSAKPLSAMDEMRKAIGAAMTRAKQTIPHFYLSQTFDLQPATDWLTKRNAGMPPEQRILMGALFVRATVRSAQKVRVMNGHYVDDMFRASERVNAGLAVALRGGGLVAPALIDADQMSLTEIMQGMRGLVSRARAGRLRNSEMTEGTITISSLGESGAEEMTGVIFPPQVALVCLGTPQTRPWVVDGEVVPRTVVTVTLSADHRVSDGRQAAQFMSEFNHALSTPEAL